MLGIEGAGAQTRTADPPEGRGRTSGRRRKIRGRVSKLPWSTTAQAVGGDGYCQNCILHCDRPAYVGFAPTGSADALRSHALLRVTLRPSWKAWRTGSAFRELAQLRACPGLLSSRGWATLRS
ncbi:hypothetical protein GLA29479_2464 [Lysobacter antibioticus]|nr:hypothetical protein GLA29479_2464 [Lysobacter antibioticus]